MASWTVRIFSASSSLILTLNSSSSDMINSTRSSESAFRSSMKFASGVTSSSLTLNCSAMIFFRRSSALAGIGLSKAPFSSCAVFDARGFTARFSGSSYWRGLNWWPLPVCARLDRSSEDTVDKLGRSFAAEEFGQFDGLVDRGPERHFSIAVQGFIESDAQHVAVDCRHLGQRPQRRAQLNQTIDVRAIGQHPTDQLLGVAGGIAQDLGRIGRRDRFAEALCQTLEDLT